MCLSCILYYCTHELVLNSINVSGVVLLFLLLLLLLLLLLFYSKYCNKTAHITRNKVNFVFVCACAWACACVWCHIVFRTFALALTLTLHLSGIVAQQSFKLKDCHENDNHTGRGGGLTHILFTGNSPYSKRT